MHAARNAALGAFDLGVAGMADQDDLAAAAGVVLAFLVNFGDQRTGRVDDRQIAVVGFDLDLLGDAVGGEYGDGTIRHVVHFLDENRALGAQAFDDVLVVHEFVADVDGRAVDFQGAFDDFDGAFDAGAETARAGQQDSQVFGHRDHLILNGPLVNLRLLQCKRAIPERWGRACPM